MPKSMLITLPEVGMELLSNLNHCYPGVWMLISHRPKNEPFLLHLYLLSSYQSKCVCNVEMFTVKFM